MSVECKSELAVPFVCKEHMHEANFIESILSEIPITIANFGDEVLEIEELLAKKMWDAIREKVCDES